MQRLQNNGDLQLYGTKSDLILNHLGAVLASHGYWLPQRCSRKDEGWKKVVIFGKDFESNFSFDHYGAERLQAAE